MDTAANAGPGHARVSQCSAGHQKASLNFNYNHDPSPNPNTDPSLDPDPGPNPAYTS